MICVALNAPHKLRKLAIETTAVVVPDHFTIVPMQMDRMNCAKKTMLLTMATSVPRPRTCEPTSSSPSAFSSNYRKQTKNNFHKKKKFHSNKLMNFKIQNSFALTTPFE